MIAWAKAMSVPTQTQRAARPDEFNLSLITSAIRTSNGAQNARQTWPGHSALVLPAKGANFPLADPRSGCWLIKCNGH